MKSSRLILALLLCCALALTRMLGVHVHDAHGHATVAAALNVHADHDDGHDHDDGAARVVVELGDHADSHLSHGEIDANTADKTAGKLPSLVLFALLAGMAAFLVPVRRGIRWPAHYASPPLRRRPHALPLSQGPPLVV